MLAGSARSTSAAEARFRVQAPNSAPREMLVIALDEKSAELGPRLSDQFWRCATFINFHKFGTSADPQAALGWRSFDLVVMVSNAGGAPGKAEAIGSRAIACGIKVSSVLLAPADDDPQAVSAALLELRPWSRTLTVIGDADYLPGALHALGA